MNKKLYTTFLTLVACLFFSFGILKGYEIDKVNFYAEGQTKTIKELIVQAKNEGKRPVLYFDATWCSACKAFDSNMSKKSMKKTLGAYRFIELDVDQDKSKLALADKYEINSIPTVVEIDEEGELIRKITGDKLGTQQEIVTIFTFFDLVK
ncbi:MAG: thioredoxin family protein [Bacteroidota bacterium]